MSKTTTRPFYLLPPWNILFEVNKLEKLTPWNINIAYLLNSFLSEMERQHRVDFRASGVALESSALIYLMKSKLLLTLQEPPPPPKPPSDIIPPPLFLPLVPQPYLPVAADILPQFDSFLQEIELQMEKLFERMFDMVKGEGIIDFRALVKEYSRMEAVRVFILLLFLAQDGRVSLWQNDETEELYITVGKLSNAGTRKGFK